MDEYLAMAQDLWNDYSQQELMDLHDAASEDRQVTFLAVNQQGYLGFIIVSIRQDYVEGATYAPTGYLEGIYVKPGYRKTGLARKLYDKGESWLVARGCTEIGSDTWTWNKASQAFHLAIGFSEEDILVHYIKKINPKGKKPS